MQNKVELLPNDVVYVEKVGNQTEESMGQLFAKINQLSSELRAQDKRVLILSNARREGKMNNDARVMAAKIGKQLDYDKSATYGSSLFLEKLRKLMISATQLDAKVANFKTREEAVKWLLEH